MKLGEETLRAGDQARRAKLAKRPEANLGYCAGLRGVDREGAGCEM